MVDPRAALDLGSPKCPSGSPSGSPPGSQAKPRQAKPSERIPPSWGRAGVICFLAFCGCFVVLCLLWVGVGGGVCLFACLFVCLSVCLPVIVFAHKQKSGSRKQISDFLISDF